MKRGIKRGLSTIVTSLILILLVLVAIVIVWIVIRNIISGGAEEVDIGKFTISLSIESVKVDGEMIDIKIKRNPGKGEMTSIKFMLKNDTDSVIVIKNVSLNELESNIFSINMTFEGISNVKEISMYAVTKTGTGKEVSGIEHNYKISSSSSSSSGGPCTPATYYADADGDSYGNATNTNMTCLIPGWLADNTDCNDADVNEHPNQVWYNDQDKDKYSNTTTITQCNRPANYNVTTELIGTNDCDNNNAAVNPGATEICNGIDDNCVNGIDEGCGGPLQCNDTRDNDADGLIDYPNDPGCTSIIDDDESDVTFLKTWLGLLSWWRFNGDINDAMGINNGTCTNCPTYNSTGKFLGAYDFDGVNDGIILPDLKVFGSNITNGTFSAWVKMNIAGSGATTCGDNGKDHPIFRAYVSSSTNLQFFYDGSSSAMWTYYTKSGGLTNQVNLKCINEADAENWNHLAITWDVNGSINLYKNGALRNSSISSLSFSGNPTYIIGSASSTYLRGTIDEAMVFNRILNSTEIQTLYGLNLSS